MIDKDKVLKGLECCCSMTGEACRQCPYDEECAEMIGSGSAHLCSDALELLKEQPEQKHGHWISFGYAHYTCSCCGTGRYMNFVPNYCSACGAKMDEEVDEQCK